jgi:predicted RecB family nuclease
MPLTAAQVTAFFEDAAQMGIPHAMVMQLQEEGITAVDDLVDLTKPRLSRLLLTYDALQEGSQIPILQRQQVLQFQHRLSYSERSLNRG